MPLYEWFCKPCDATFERIQPSTTFAGEQVRCPLCRTWTSERLSSAPGIAFKGTGWYCSDYKEKPKE